MSEIKVDWNGHVKKYQAAMEELNLDFCVLTRVKSITYLAGCFVPWKSTIFLPKRGEGEPELFTVLLDQTKFLKSIPSHHSLLLFSNFHNESKLSWN